MLLPLLAVCSVLTSWYQGNLNWFPYHPTMASTFLCWGSRRRLSFLWCKSTHSMPHSPWPQPQQLCRPAPLATVLAWWQCFPQVQAAASTGRWVWQTAVLLLGTKCLRWYCCRNMQKMVNVLFRTAACNRKKVVAHIWGWDMDTFFFFTVNTAYSVYSTSTTWL